MSQIEQDFRQFLSKHPEIEICYQDGLINRRSLARYLIKKNIAKQNQLEAAIAMLRRYNFQRKKGEECDELFRNIRVNIKDSILVLDFEKSKELLRKLEKIFAHTDYDKGDTLKIVVGSSSIKLFIDKKNEGKLKEIFLEYKPKKIEHISELSLLFPEKATSSKGILSTLTKEFVLNDINITEFLTASPELLIYLKEEYVLKAYEIIKRLQK
jgi:hypothetical protein